MGKGIDLAKQYGDPKMAQAIEDMKDQLIIVLVKRLQDSNGEVVIPLKEMDDTQGDLLGMEMMPNGDFVFKAQKKS